MKFGYTIMYVVDVEKALSFYEKAFGMKTKFLHESGQYGELDTGNTILAFASLAFARQSIQPDFYQSAPGKMPAAFEIAFLVDDVAQAFKKAVAAGAHPLSEPGEKPWGQIVAHVQDINGTIVELATPLNNS